MQQNGLHISVKVVRRLIPKKGLTPYRPSSVHG
ncbi:hypothetical protein [Bengtsoniella intestinalis]